MLIALIGDVHTNIPAWLAVLEDWTRLHADVDRVWSLGDWLGYSQTHPMHLWSALRRSEHPAVVRLMQDPGSHGVIGNHDLGLIDCGYLDACFFNDKARSALDSQRNQVKYDRHWKQQFLKWLQTQRKMLSPRRGVYLAHGAFTLDAPEHIPCRYTPRFPQEWSLQQIQNVLTLNQNQDALNNHYVAIEDWEAPIVLITGHTHQQRVWQREMDADSPKWPVVPDSWAPDDVIREAIEQCVPVTWSVKVQPTKKRPVWLNPGSVGVQRDLRTPRPAPGWEWARYALLEPIDPDWSTLTIHLRWVPYPVQS